MKHYGKREKILLRVVDDLGSDCVREESGAYILIYHGGSNQLTQNSADKVPKNSNVLLGGFRMIIRRVDGRSMV